MANHVISRVELESNSKEIHNYIQNFDESCTGINNSDSCDNTCKIVFGKDWKYDMNKIGSKWIFVETRGNWNVSNKGPDITDELVFCSAWDFPVDFFEYLNKELLKISEEFEMVVIVEEESGAFVGGAVGNKFGFEYIQNDDIEPIDWDSNDDEYRNEYWDKIDKAKIQCVSDARETLGV